MIVNRLVENAEMHRFELSVDDDVAVAYFQEQDGRIVLLLEVPQRLSGQGIGSCLAHAVFETLRARGRRVIAKCPFMSAYAVKHPEYIAMLDG